MENPTLALKALGYIRTKVNWAVPSSLKDVRKSSPLASSVIRTQAS
jgi:hypothetical protein